MSAMHVKIAIFSSCLALGLTLVLVPSLKAANPQGEDILTQVFGGTTQIAADAAYKEADVYFHGGVSGGCHHHDNCGHDEDADGGAHGSLPLISLIEKLHGETAPREHRHLNGVEEKELLPWFVAAVNLNPQCVEAWCTGTYWFYHTGDRARAERFISDGIRANPDDYSVYMERGILYHRLGRWASSLNDLAHARRLWKYRDLDDQYNLKAIDIYSRDSGERLSRSAHRKA